MPEIGAGALQGHRCSPASRCATWSTRSRSTPSRQGLLTVAKQGKKNIFSGRILEIEGLPDLKVEQAFELSDASAERSRRRLHGAPQPGADHRVPHQQHRADEEHDRRRLPGRAHAGAPHQGAWKPGSPTRSCSKADADAEYAAVIEIDLADVKEPIVACPNDPDDVKLLSRSRRRQDRRGVHRLVHDQHRPLPRRGQAARRQARHPGQAVGRAADQDGRAAAHQGRPLRHLRHAPARAPRCPAAACAWATRRRCAKARRWSRPATRNFPNRLGKNTNVYLGSAELAAICVASWAASRPWPSTWPTWAC